MNYSNKLVNLKEYYESMVNTYTQRKQDAIETLNALCEECNDIQFDIISRHEYYKSMYNIDLFKYKELINNEYKNGEFYRFTEKLYLNKGENYTLRPALFKLYSLARKQKEVQQLDKEIMHCDKILSVDKQSYSQLVKAYYTKITDLLVDEAAGYAFSGRIGWICIARLKLNRNKKFVDYQLTRRKKKELIEQGKEVFDKDKKDWADEVGVEYNPEDYRVYREADYAYCCKLVGCHLLNPSFYEFKAVDGIGASLRGVTYDQMVELADNDPAKIRQLDIDFLKKVILIDKVDKTFYTKFIRHENQEPTYVSEANR